MRSHREQVTELRQSVDHNGGPIINWRKMKKLYKKRHAPYTFHPSINKVKGRNGRDKAIRLWGANWGVKY